MSKTQTATVRQSILVRNVQIGDLVRSVRFISKPSKDGGVVVFAKAGRDLPKLVLRRQNAKSVIGHLPGKRDEPNVTATSERSAFAKMVEAFWLPKPKKAASWASAVADIA